jgi:hypothetical protein
MLIRFAVENFRSFRNEQQFTFSTSSDRMHAATHCMRTGLKSVPRVSKAAVVFGPNGSGKTNLLTAVAVMRDMVLHSTTFSAADFAERYSPFLLDRSQGRPTEFEVDVVLDRVRYQYAFAYDGRRICAERLLVFPTGKSQRWFERTLVNEHGLECWAPFSNNFTGPRAMWRDATRAQALFLTTAAQLNARQLAPLFDWFEHGLAVVFGSEKLDLGHLAESVKDDRRKRVLLEFLRGAGIKMHDVRIAEPPAAAIRPVERGRLPAKPSHGDPKAIEFSHLRDDGSVVWMPSADESTGAQRLAGLFAPLLTAVQRGQVLLIDEFDLSLHPLVARYLIQLFNDPKLSNNGAQLLLTSHNTNLMDMDLLRRDEIWLMELDANAASTLLRMWHSASPPRKHELIGKRYLFGRYGAVPAIRLADTVREAAETVAVATTGSQRKKADTSLAAVPRIPRI